MRWRSRGERVLARRPATSRRLAVLFFESPRHRGGRDRDVPEQIEDLDHEALGS
jgi:hypothetical protein